MTKITIGMANNEVTWNVSDEARVERLVKFITKVFGAPSNEHLSDSEALDAFIKAGIEADLVGFDVSIGLPDGWTIEEFEDDGYDGYVGFAFVSGGIIPVYPNEDEKVDELLEECDVLDDDLVVEVGGEYINLGRTARDYLDEHREEFSKAYFDNEKSNEYRVLDYSLDDFTVDEWTRDLTVKQFTE
jgi:hypothetical protein